MKQLHILLRHLPIWLLVCTMLSCSKESIPPGTASLTLVNAVPVSTSLVTNFSETNQITWYVKALKLTYGTVTSASIALPYAGTQYLAVYHYPDTTEHSTPLFNLILDLPAGSIHTLFLTGTLANPDTLFTTDILPFHSATDSSLSVRFVNLMSGSDPVSVNINGLAHGSEVSSLFFKGITSFTDYPAMSNVANYNFEFRDAATGNLIGSYNLTGINNSVSTNTRRFRNFTLALMGLSDDPSTWKTVLIDNN